MKHLLIILSILLSSPLFGDNHKGETLYRWKFSSGNWMKAFTGYVWKTFGDEEDHPVYKGQVENREPNGQGTFTFPNGEKYVGEWKNGKRWNGIKYNKNGNIQYKFVNGELIKP